MLNNSHDMDEIAALIKKKLVKFQIRLTFYGFNINVP